MSESRLGHRSSLHRRSGRVMGGLAFWREIHWYHVFLCSILVAFRRWSRKGASCLEAPKRYPEPHPPSLPPSPPPGNGSRSSVSFGWRRTGNTRSDVKRKCGPSAPPGTLWSAIPSHGVWYRYRASHEGARGPARYLCRGVGEARPARDLLCRACIGCLLHTSLPLPRHVDAEIAYSSI